MDLWLSLAPPGRARETAWRLCRRVLAERLGRNDFTVARTPTGKPYLERERVGFSLSHAERLVACCVSGSRHVGVDVEPLASGARVLRLGEYVLASHELREVDPARAALLWTSKEAYVKAYGTTLGDVDPAALGFELARGRATLRSGGVGPAFARVLVHAEHAVAVAARGVRPFELRVHHVGG